MERLLRLGGQGLSGMGSQSPESSQNDTAEQVKIISRGSKVTIEVKKLLMVIQH